ncbi:hypothetical protein [Qaidamihabitans albus]|uniref:hypothetical protein n=1 Tax=Qaidamihabitans albus TaxID=2795733 RepID=UPI0018F164FC|nr:hypothetical protein [Qaidamihabitans albus]
MINPAAAIQRAAAGWLDVIGVDPLVDAFFVLVLGAAPAVRRRARQARRMRSR